MFPHNQILKKKKIRKQFDIQIRDTKKKLTKKQKRLDQILKKKRIRIKRLPSEELSRRLLIRKLKT